MADSIQDQVKKGKSPKSPTPTSKTQRTQSRLAKVPKQNTKQQRKGNKGKTEKPKSGWQQLKDVVNPVKLASGVGQFGVDVVKTGANLANPMTYAAMATGDESIQEEMANRLPAAYTTGKSVYDTGKRLSSVELEAVNKFKHGDYIGAAKNASMLMPTLPGIGANPVNQWAWNSKTDGVMSGIHGTDYEDAVRDGTIVGAVVEDASNIAMVAGGAGLAAKSVGKFASKAALAERGAMAANPAARKFALGAADAPTPAAFAAENAPRLAKIAKLEKRAATANNFSKGINSMAQPFSTIAKQAGVGSKFSKVASNIAKSKQGTTIGKYASYFRPEQRAVRKNAGDITSAMTREIGGVSDTTRRAVGIAPEGSWSAVMELGERTADQWSKVRSAARREGVGDAGSAAWDKFKQDIIKQTDGRLDDANIDLAVDAHEYRTARNAGDIDTANAIAELNPDAKRVADALDEVSGGEFGAGAAARKYGEEHPEQLRAEQLPGSAEEITRAASALQSEMAKGSKAGIKTKAQKLKIADDTKDPAILRPYLEAGKASRESINQMADIVEQAGDMDTAALLRQDADKIVTNLEEFRAEGLLEGIIDEKGNINPDKFGAFFSHSPVSEYFDDMAEGNAAFAPPNPPGQSNVMGSIKKQASEHRRKGSKDFVRTPQAYVIRRMNEISQRMTRKMWDDMTDQGVLKNLEDPQFEGTLWRKYNDGDLLAEGEFVRDGVVYMPLKEGLALFNETSDFPFDLVNPRDPLGRALKDWPKSDSIQWKRGELRMVPRDVRNSFEKRMTRKHGMGEDMARLFFDKPNQFMKMFVLGLSPAWHVGNVFGNMVLSMAVGGMTPLDLYKGGKKAIQDYRASGGTDGIPGRSRKQVKADLKAKGGSRDARRAAESERSWFTPDSQRLEASGLSSAQQEFLRKPIEAGPIRSRLDDMTGGRRPLEALVQSSYRANSFVDNFNRSTMYNAKIMKGATPDVAVKEALNALGDFSRMTPFEQNVVRRIMPFYAWQRHVTQFALRLPYEHPYRVAWLLNLGNIYGNEEGLINLWGDTYINSGNIVPFADWGAFLTPGSAKDAIAKGMAPVPRILIGDQTNLNLSRGGDVPFSMPPGSEGEAPSIRNQVQKAFLGKQIRLADGLTGRDQISRYDNGDPRFRGSSAVPYKSEGRSRLSALGGYAGFNVGSPEVAADINKSKTKKKNDLAKTKKRYEAKKKLYGG